VSIDKAKEIKKRWSQGDTSHRIGVIGRWGKELTTLSGQLHYTKPSGDSKLAYTGVK